MATKIRGATALTGGGTGAVDAISGAVLADGDIVIAVYDGQIYTYVVDADSGLAESSPHIIAPDVSAGDKRLILQSMSDEIDVLAIYGDGVNRTRTAIEAAKTALGTVNKYTFLIRRETWTIDDDLTITSNLTLRVVPGALLQIASGKTLTINGPFEAGLYQAFSGAGTVTFGSGSVKEVYPEWWGAKGDDSTDCTAVFNTASLAASTSRTLRLSDGTYRVTAISGATAVTFYGSVKGNSPNTSIIKNVGAGSAVIFKGTNDAAGDFYYVRVENFSVVGNAGSEDGISVNPTGGVHRAVAYSIFNNIDTHGHGRHGLVHRASWGTVYTNIQSYENGGLGVWLISTAPDVNYHNQIRFVNPKFRHNGGTGDNGADFEKGGIRIDGGAQGVYLDGPLVESNNAWGIIIGNGAVYTAYSVTVVNPYFEDNPKKNGAASYSALGGNVYVGGLYERVEIKSGWGTYGAGTGGTGYGFYVATSATSNSYFKEHDNYLSDLGGGTNVRDYGIMFDWTKPYISKQFGDPLASGGAPSVTTILTVDATGRWAIKGWITIRKYSETTNAIYPFMASRAPDADGGNLQVALGTAIGTAPAIPPTIAWSGGDLQVTLGVAHYASVEIDIGGMAGYPPDTLAFPAVFNNDHAKRSK